MKKTIIFIAAFILSACSQPSADQPDVASPQITATQITINTAIPFKPTPDKVTRAIQSSFLYGGHANEFSCEQCHLDDSEARSGKLSWTDKVTGLLEVISSPTQLCVKCHEGQAAYTTSQGGNNLLAHGDFECTTCHDPHDVQASCTGSLCHSEIQTARIAQIAKPENHAAGGDITSHMCGGSACHELVKLVNNTPVYHQPIHQAVPCYVCHDGSGLEVLLIENQYWITTDVIQQGSAATKVVSHTIEANVDCTKCHFVDNPWNLQGIPVNDEE